MIPIEYYRGNFIDDMKPDDLRAALKEVISIYSEHLREVWETRESLRKILEDK